MLAHVGHQGIVKTKCLIREKVWFPGIDKMVKDKVDNCLACQAVVPSKSSRIALIHDAGAGRSEGKQLNARSVRGNFECKY